MSPDNVFVPVEPAEFSVLERYSYRQVLSSNPRLEPDGSPAGKVTLVCPFDGAEQFSRQAADAVLAQMRRPGAATLLLGHLGLDADGRTDLTHALGDVSDFRTVPLRTPASSLGNPLEQGLTGDRSRAVFETDYRPQSPRILPIRVEAELFDEESFNINSDRLAVRSGFCRWLVVRFSIVVVVSNATPAPTVPVLEELFVPWPGIPSMNNFRAQREREILPICFDPDRKGLAWGGLEFTRQENGMNGDSVHFILAPLYFFIRQPAELRQQHELTFDIRVRLTNCLLSSARLRFFGANGRGDGPLGFPNTHTELRSSVRLAMGDLFAMRPRQPWLSIRFEHVIPEKERINNIIDELVDMGFTAPLEPEERNKNPKRPLWELRVERQEGRHLLKLNIMVTGSLRTIEVDRVVEDRNGMRTVRGSRDTGDLEIAIMAEFKDQDAKAGACVNQLHERLRNRFRGAVNEG